MSEHGESQRFCTNCGSEVRSGSIFCVRCGVRVVQGDPLTGDTNNAHSESRFTYPKLPDFHELIFNGKEYLRNLPRSLKFAVVGVVVLAVIIVGSPIISILAMVLFVGCLVVLSIRLVRREHLGIVAVVTPFALIFTVFSLGASTFLYGGNPISSIGGVFRQDEQVSTSVLEATYEEDAEIATDVEVPPELEAIGEDWPDRAELLWSERDPPLLVPYYLPFEISDAWVPTNEDFLSYRISMADAGYFSGDADLSLMYLGDGYLNSGLPGVEAFSTDEGRPYYYSYEFDPADSARGGIHSIVFWEESSQGEVANAYRLSTTASAITPDQFTEILISMRRVDES